MEILDPSIQEFASDYYTRTALYDYIGPDTLSNVAFYYSCSRKEIEISAAFDSEARVIRPALYVKAEGIPENITGIQVAFGGQWWYVVGQGVNGSVPGPENTVTLFENPSAPQQSSTAREYMGSPLQEAMAGFGSNLTLAGKESSLIVPRTLTTADEITGSTAADQPFWPLSKSEAERIGNTDILKAENINPLACYWLCTTDPDGTDFVYAVNANDGSVASYYAPSYYGVRPAFYLDISNAFYLAKDAKRVTIGGNPYPLVLEGYEEYKYTIFDDSLKLSVTADPTQASQTGNTLSFGYVATTGENLYLACVLTADGDNNVLYYNTLADLTEASAASGTVNIPLTGVADGDYTLRLYTEQQNSKSTDFASPSVDVQITVNSGVASIRNLGNVQLVGDSGGQGGEDGREVELRTNDTHIQWRYKGETEWKDLVALSDITGSDGADGKQVELRVEGGYIQWKYDADSDWQNLIALSALQGIKGDKGDKGDPGDTPTIGSNGNWWIGTTDTSIKAAGTDGSDGKDGKDGVNGVNGVNGKDGADGKNGTNGKDGADGVGIADIKLNENGELIVTLTDSTVKNLGKVKGEDGVGISGVSINENGELIVTLTDGTELNAGAVPTAAAGDSNLKTLVYVSMGTAGVSLAGLLGLLAFLLTKRKMLIGK